VRVTKQKQTAADRIRIALTDAIVSGKIGQGAMLDEAVLAKKFSVSRTPVREAIRQLEAIGFAEARPHRGAIVPHFTPRKLDEMIAVMAELEVFCAGLAAESPNEDDIERLKTAHARCTDAARTGDVDLYYRENLTFHDTIYALGQNEFLAEVTLSVRNRVLPFRKAQFRSPDRLEAAVKEHGQVLDAIIGRDPQSAAQAMREHLRVLREPTG
jgi:DNA-binding GntR family transcriptional regulator